MTYLPDFAFKTEKSPSLMGTGSIRVIIINYTARVTLPLRRQRVHT